MNDLLENIDKVHTTPMGTERISRNIGVPCNKITEILPDMLVDPDAIFERRGKNWYVKTRNCLITINARSFTVITAHRIKTPTTKML